MSVKEAAMSARSDALAAMSIVKAETDLPGRYWRFLFASQGFAVAHDELEVSDLRPVERRKIDLA